MVTRALPSFRRSVALLPLAVFLLIGCKPDGGASPTSAATMAVARTAQPAPTAAATAEPAPSDDGATAGEAQPSATLEPAPSVSPTATPAPEVAEAERKPFAMNLYRKGDFVAQYNFELCVGASLQ